MGNEKNKYQDEKQVSGQTYSEQLCVICGKFSLKGYNKRIHVGISLKGYDKPIRGGISLNGNNKHIRGGISLKG